MTLLSSESPSVTVKEIDLTGIVPAVTSTTGAIVGDFNWGPVNTPILIGNESELASTFGSPLSGDAYAGDFLSASYFLKYSSSAFIVRASRPDILDSDGTVAYPGHAKASAGVFEAKYFGELGNTITVSAVDSTYFDTWDFEGFFTAPPVGDELHVVVSLGYVSSSKLGNVVETYEFVSTDPNAKLPNGSNNFVADVIKTLRLQGSAESSNVCTTCLQTDVIQSLAANIATLEGCDCAIIHSVAFVDIASCEHA